ncbi:hypothetical protein C8R47DRAFT_565427 [Mycena vitilis]|nr:hypothetical protein C8R47DRAFT_565427 [Mycena vitilis]
MLAALPFLLIFLLSGAAANNWDVACKGECSYDIPDAAISGTLKITGASNAVSDVTSAGGWTILDCNASALIQDIRLVCHSSDCEHLFEGHGAIDTLIRLPETCGRNAFARVADINVDANQALPDDLTITQPGNITSMVFVLSVDTDFAAVNTTKTGPVSFSLEGYNYPVDTVNVSANSTSKRGLKMRNWTAFNKSNSVDLPPIHIDETFPLMSASVDCADVSATVSASFETKLDATISIGLIAAGTVLPPKINELAVYAGIDSSILGTLHLESKARGTVSSGKVSLYSTALGGINFPGIFSLGPTFGIYGELEATVDADISVDVDLAYDLDNVRMYYPPDSETSTGSCAPSTSTLVLSAIPDLALNTKITPMLIPEIKLGLEAFNFIKASVSLDVEGSIIGTFNIDGNTTTSTASDDVSGKIEACADIGAALSVNVDAEGSLSLMSLSHSDKYTIFSDKWDLYNKCGAATTKREVPVSSGLGRRADLTCPTPSSVITSIEKIIDEVVSDIKSNTS